MSLIIKHGPSPRGIYMLPKEGVDTDTSLDCINACVWMYILKFFNITYTILYADSLWYGVLSWKQLVDSRMNI